MSNREFNVGGSEVVVAPGETFQWVATYQEVGDAAPGAQYPFSTDPPITSGQKLIIASRDISDPCSDVVVRGGNHFIWRNHSQENDYTFTAVDSWPLPEHSYLVRAQSAVAVKVPSNTPPGDYPFTVTNSDNSNACGRGRTQPKLSIGGGPF